MRRTGAKWLSAYNFAFADCMKPPVIHSVERREGCIRVQATDNIGVTRVRVSVLDEAGRLLVNGAATRADDDPRHAGRGSLLISFIV